MSKLKTETQLPQTIVTSSPYRILNLYAGIGGNRKLWNDENFEITAIEYDQATADVYKKHFPKDTVIVTDAHEYLLKNYMNFDFVWSSPPCPTHSDIRRCGVHAGQYEALYPNMELYQEILLLQNFHKKHTKFVVENVVPYYNCSLFIGNGFPIFSNIFKHWFFCLIFHFQFCLVGFLKWFVWVVYK